MVKVVCRLLVLSTVLMALLFSCKRQCLEEPHYFIANVPVTIDWSESLLDEKDIMNVSICAYPIDGSEPVRLLSDNIYFNVLELPVGEYDILIYNELLGDVKGLGNSGSGKFDEVRSHILPMENPSIIYDTLRVNDVVAENHELISTWSMRDLVVSEEMVQLTRSEEYKKYIEESRNRSDKLMQIIRTKSESDDVVKPTLPQIPSVEGSADAEGVMAALKNLSEVYPECENTVLRFDVRVKNLNNAMKVEALVRGTEYGAYLANGMHEEYEGKRIVYENIVRSRTFDDPNNGIDGNMYLTVNTFGVKGPNDRYYVDFSCATNSGQLYKFSFDITEAILEAGSSKYIKIDLGSIDSPAIILPESGEAGFDVGDWDDEIIVDIC